MDENAGKYTTPQSLFFMPAKRYHHKHYKTFARGNCERLLKGNYTISEAV
jgi:hypothetical protein